MHLHLVQLQLITIFSRSLSQFNPCRMESCIWTGPTNPRHHCPRSAQNPPPPRPHRRKPSRSLSSSRCPGPPRPQPRRRMKTISQRSSSALHKRTNHHDRFRFELCTPGSSRNCPPSYLRYPRSFNVTNGTLFVYLYTPTCNMYSTGLILFLSDTT
jgi:hypothetical protein